MRFSYTAEQTYMVQPPKQPKPPTEKEPDTLFHNSRKTKNLALEVGESNESHHGRP